MFFKLKYKNVFFTLIQLQAIRLKWRLNKSIKNCNTFYNITGKIYKTLEIEYYLLEVLLCHLPLHQERKKLCGLLNELKSGKICIKCSWIEWDSLHYKKNYIDRGLFCLKYFVQSYIICFSISWCMNKLCKSQLCTKIWI